MSVRTLALRSVIVGCCVLSLMGVCQADTLTLISGNAAIGERDFQNLWSTNDGITYDAAYVVRPHPSYHIIPGTQYISSHPTKFGPQFAWTSYATTFVLPDGFQNPSLSIWVHADNAAAIYLNDHLVGEQPLKEIFPNFRDPADFFESIDPVQFVAGTNTLTIDVYNFFAETALDYLAEVTFDVPVVVEVPIDLKPGSFPNSLNLKSSGKTTVAILSTPDFDATTVDPETVTFASAPVAMKRNGTLMASIEDVNDDGLPDMVFHFLTRDLDLAPGDVTGVLQGETFDGMPVEGMDLVRIVR